MRSDDPFSRQPDVSSASRVPPPPPTPPMAPGMYAGHTAAPVGLARATLWATGVVTVLTLASAALAPHFVQRARTWTVDTLEVTPHEIVDLVSLPAYLAAWIVMCLWMSAASRYLTATGHRQSLSHLWAWFGWIIPIAGLVLPAMVMSGINRFGKGAWIAGWWAGFLGWNLATNVAGAAVSWDGTVDVSALDSYANLMMIAAVALAISWYFLYRIVTDFIAGVRHATPQYGY